MYCYSFSVIPLIFLKQKWKLIHLAEAKTGRNPKALEYHGISHLPHYSQGSAEEDMIIFCVA